MKRTAIFTALILAGLTTLRAQDEYRISQPIPDSIDRIEVNAGWQVRIKHGDQSSVTIVTPCSVFFDEDNEPQISTVKGRMLTLLPNKSMPQSTVVEITLQRKIRHLYIEKNATVETGNLYFAGKSAKVHINDNAVVKGRKWLSDNNLDVQVDYDATLAIDTLQAEDRLEVSRFAGARLDCPTLISSNTVLYNDKKSFGTLYQSDTSRNLTVKNQNRGWVRPLEGLSISFGLTSPIPLYMNNKSGSPYNRGENYRISMYMGFLKPISIAKNFNFQPWIAWDCDWSRLLNNVVYDGNALVLNTPSSGEIPQQHLYSESIGLRLQFNYEFGKVNGEKGLSPYKLSFGINAMRNGNAKLVTRTMGTDNRWHRTRERIDVMNPWQLRTFVSIGGGPITRASIGISYDLLPTFRTGTDLDKIHTFGVTFSF